MIGEHAIGEQPIGSFRQFLLLAGGAAVVSLSTSYRLLAATQEFATAPTDALSSVPFEGRLQRSLRVDRSILSGDRIGAMSSSWGELELNNSDGFYDDIVERYAVDGRRVVVKIGSTDRSYDRFFTVFDGTSLGWDVAEDVLRISLRDQSIKLEKPVSPNVYDGLGNLGGGADLKGKRRPLSFGYVENISPPLVIPLELIFQVHDGPVAAIPAVYDRGVALTFVRDHGTSAALREVAMAPGQFATCLAEGLFRLGGSAAGTVTADVWGDNTGGVFVVTTADIIRRIVGKMTAVADPGGLVVRTFDTLNALQPAAIGYHVSADSTQTVREVVDLLLTGIGGYADFRRNGMLAIGRFDEPSGTPGGQYTEVDIIDIERMRLPAGVSPPPWRFRVTYGRNWTVQDDLAGSVGAARIAYLAEAFRTAPSTDANLGLRIKASHSLAQDPDPVESYFRTVAEAAAEADRLLSLYSATRSLYRVTLRLQPYVHEVGDVVSLTFPRFDLKSGRLARIVGISEDPDAGRIELTTFG